MIGEPAGSVHEIAIGTMIEQAKDGKVSKEAINNAVANPSVDNQSIKEVVDVAVNTGQVTPEVAEQINKQVDVAEEINKTIPTQIQNDQDRAKAINLIEQRKEVETAMESVDEAFKPALKERIDAINSELTDLANKPQPAQEATIEETPTFETDQTEAAQPIELSTEVANQPQRETEAPTGNYEIAQEATKVVSEENPDASVLLTPKGEDLSLTAVFVKNEKRNKGVGTKVLESVKRQADKLGKKVVLDATTELDEETDLERLGNFYERNGFEKIGENKYQYTPKGQEEKVNPALNDVEGTAKALEDIDKTKWNEVSKLSPLKQGAYKERSDLHSAIAEAYHADKSAGKETELTKAVEQLLTPNTNQNEQETINAESEKSSNESPRDENGQQTQEENVSEEAKPKPYAEAFAEIEKAKRSKKIPSEKTKAAKEAVKALGKIGQDALFIDENFDTISKRLTNDKKVKFERIC
jgi:GNAT superfamily N-acetyltransferase